MSSRAISEAVETRELFNRIGHGSEAASRPMCVGTENTLTLMDNWLINDIMVGVLRKVRVSW